MHGVWLIRGNLLDDGFDHIPPARFPNRETAFRLPHSTGTYPGCIVYVVALLSIPLARCSCAVGYGTT
jgi:hypothetical protein